MSQHSNEHRSVSDRAQHGAREPRTTAPGKRPLPVDARASGASKRPATPDRAAIAAPGDSSGGARTATSWMNTAMRPDLYPAPDEPVQADNGRVDSADVAARGFSGSAGPLPALPAIQAAFGRHDVSGVRAHTDADAQRAAHALGARGYASGDRVALSGAADLRTVAHEAAHVVQQRHGAVPAGGVGAPGDHLERHADAVADRVVAGQSAEPLLDEIAGGGAPARAVQLDSDSESSTPGMIEVLGDPSSTDGTRPDWNWERDGRWEELEASDPEQDSSSKPGMIEVFDDPSSTDTESWSETGSTQPGSNWERDRLRERREAPDPKRDSSSKPGMIEMLDDPWTDRLPVTRRPPWKPPEFATRPLYGEESESDSSDPLTLPPGRARPTPPRGGGAADRKPKRDPFEALPPPREGAMARLAELCAIAKKCARVCAGTSAALCADVAGSDRAKKRHAATKSRAAILENQFASYVESLETFEENSSWRRVSLDADQLLSVLGRMSELALDLAELAMSAGQYRLIPQVLQAADDAAAAAGDRRAVEMGDDKRKPSRKQQLGSVVTAGDTMNNAAGLGFGGVSIAEASGLLTLAASASATLGSVGAGAGTVFAGVGLAQGTKNAFLGKKRKRKLKRLEKHTPSPGNELSPARYAIDQKRKKEKHNTTTAAMSGAAVGASLVGAASIAFPPLAPVALVMGLMVAGAGLGVIGYKSSHKWGKRKHAPDKLAQLLVKALNNPEQEDAELASGIVISLGLDPLSKDQPDFVKALAAEIRQTVGSQRELMASVLVDHLTSGTPSQRFYARQIIHALGLDRAKLEALQEPEAVKKVAGKLASW